MGRLFLLVIFDGDFILINFYDRIQGIFILFLGLLFYGYSSSLGVAKCLELYYIEMGYLNWFFGDLFRKGGFFLLFLGE